MAAEFLLVPDPPDALTAQAAALDPTNPFQTPAYSAAMRSLGWRSWLVGLHDRGALVAGCLAFGRLGVLIRTLSINSLPELQDPTAFWSGLLRFCTENHVLTLSVDTCGSPRASIPERYRDRSRGCIWEYVVDLAAGDLWGRLWESHREWITRARQCGLRVEQATGLEAGRRHAELVRASRNAESPSVAEVGSFAIRARVVDGLLRHGAAEIVQAVKGQELLASALVLRAKRGAYLHSIMGMTAEGASLGGAHLLLWEWAGMLRAGAGIATFNLGQADESNAWFEALKAGFGTTRIDRVTAQLALGGRVRRKLGSAMRQLKEDPVGLFRYLTGHSERYLAYVADPSTLGPISDPVAGATLRRLSLEELDRLAAGSTLAAWHADRIRRLGFNDAHGVFLDGELAHISWLITADHDTGRPARNVKLRAGEAEIGPCTTAARGCRDPARLHDHRGSQQIVAAGDRKGGIDPVRKCGSLRDSVRIRQVGVHLSRPSLETGPYQRWRTESSFAPFVSGMIRSAVGSERLRPPR
jgi:hypothetical protein